MTNRTRLLGGWLYVALVFGAGATILVSSVASLASEPFHFVWVLLALFAWGSGYFSIKVPAVPATISLTEAFLFTQVLLFGAAPAAITVSLDGLVSSLRRGNRQARRLLFNVAEPAVSVWTASWVAEHLAGLPHLADGGAGLGSLLAPAVLFVAVYFAMNTGFIAVAISTETGESPVAIWRSHLMGLLWLSHCACMSIAVFLALNVHHLDVRSIAIVVPLVVIANMAFKTWAARIEDTHQHLGEMNRLHIATVETLAMAIDAKDQVTHGHLRRVQSYALQLASAVGMRDELELKALAASGLLHDMGKLAVPDYILNKPGRLTTAEYEQIKLHAEVGAEILGSVDFPYPVVPIVRHHHECWDGTGYPDGLAGDVIPLGARILAVIDCYDALTSDRPYRPALPTTEALAIIQERRGTMYDPHVVDTFMALQPRLMDLPVAAVKPITALARITQSTRRRPVAAESMPLGGPQYTDDLLRWSDLARALIGRARIEDVGALIAQQVGRLTPATLTVLYTVEHGGTILRLAHASGAGTDVLSDFTVPVGYGLSGWIVANQTTIVNADPALDLGPLVARISRPPRSALATPLVASGGVVGVLALYAEERDAFSQEHRVLVEFLARQVAPVLERAVEVERERGRTHRDPITGMPNERSLEQLLAIPAVFDAARGAALGVLCVQLQRPGDAAARAAQMVKLARAVARVVRVADFVFHSGPSEIVVLMPQCESDAGEGLRARIGRALAGDAIGPATDIRAGFAAASSSGEPAADLVTQARQQARSEGRRASLVVPPAASVQVA